jgi:hypothetical protein
MFEAVPLDHDLPPEELGPEARMDTAGFQYRGGRFLGRQEGLHQIRNLRIALA